MSDETATTDNRYPEHDKVRAVKNESQRLGAFIEWLNEKDMQICEGEEGLHGVRWYPTTKNIERLLAEYFEIDLQKVGEEKDAMVAEMRSANG